MHTCVELATKISFVLSDNCATYERPLKVVSDGPAARIVMDHRTGYPNVTASLSPAAHLSLLLSLSSLSLASSAEEAMDVTCDARDM